MEGGFWKIGFWVGFFDFHSCSLFLAFSSINSTFLNQAFLFIYHGNSEREVNHFLIYIESPAERKRFEREEKRDPDPSMTYDILTYFSDEKTFFKDERLEVLDTDRRSQIDVFQKKIEKKRKEKKRKISRPGTRTAPTIASKHPKPYHKIWPRFPRRGRHYRQRQLQYRTQTLVSSPLKRSSTDTQSP